MRNKIITALFVAGLMVVTSAKAGNIIYDSVTGATSTGHDSVQGIGTLYDSFTSAGSAQALSGVRLTLFGPGSGTGTLTIGLYADSGSATPGALITQLAQISDTNIISGYNTYTFSLSGTTLAAGTRYWIGLTDSGESGIAWAWTSTTSGTGVAGEHYNNSAGTFPNTSGPYIMQVDTVTPVNDTCAEVITVYSPTYTNIQSTANATSTGDPTPACASGGFGKGVWYEYTPPTAGILFADTINSDFDTVLAVYTGTCGSLTQVACDDDSGANHTSKIPPLLLTGGTTYYFLAGGYGAGGNLHFNMAFYPVPLNDTCAGAITVSGPTYINTQSTIAATSTGDPTPSCVTSFGNGVWYQYTPASGGQIVVDTIGSDFDTALAIYTGTCGSLTEAACNDDGTGIRPRSMITMSVTGGTAYHILAGGFGEASGNLSLRLYTTGTVPAAPVPISPNTSGQTATPTYTFNTVPGATSYTIFLWDYTTASSTVYASLTPAQVDPGNTGIGQFLQTTPLAPGAYTWVVSASNGSGTSPNSIYMTFNVGAVPATPVPISPKTPGQSPTPTYTFNTVSGATSYTIFLWDYATASSTVFGPLTPTQVDPGSTGQGHFVQPTALATGTYTWVVSASNASGASPWSVYMTFKVGP